MKKVAIITWYWGNYGSTLQAYALNACISKFGFECDTIQHNINGKALDNAKYRLRKFGIYKTLKIYEKKIKSKFKYKKFLKLLSIRNLAFNKFISKYIKLSKETYSLNNLDNLSKNYDVFVCGSDQIWNPALTCLTPFYWLDFVNTAEGKKRVFSYAPSIGESSFNSHEVKKISEYLKLFDYISVREDKSVKILENVIEEKKVFKVVDPTLLLTKGEWDEICSNKYPDGEYLFAYLIRSDKKQMDYISNIAKKNNLKIVTYPFLEIDNINENYDGWGDEQIFDDSPSDFLSIIKNSKLIFTDSYHCSVFSLIYEKDFYVLKKANDVTNQFERLDSLLKMTKTENRKVDVSEDLFVQVQTDFEETNRIIDIQRKESIDFLKKGLGVY